MQPLSITIFAFSQSLAWALFYSLWQGMLLYGIVYAVVRAMPSMNARIKYLLSYGALTGTIVWFADTWTSQYQKIKGVTAYITEMGINNAPDNIIWLLIHPRIIKGQMILVGKSREILFKVV